jgi:hypothetical protein
MRPLSNPLGNFSLVRAPTRYTGCLVLGSERATRHVSGCGGVPQSSEVETSVRPERQSLVMAWRPSATFARLLRASRR